MKNILYLVFLLALLSGNIYAQSVYRCQVDGELIFSQIPCATDAKEHRLIPGSGSTTGPTEAFKEVMREHDYQVAAERGQLMIGMPVRWVLRAWGEPDRINSTTSQAGVREQWVYRRANFRNQYVYLRNGIVESISNH